jgi:hypothetical protein
VLYPHPDERFALRPLVAVAATAAAFLSLGAAASQAATVTFSASADTYVDSSRPTVNFGSLNKLRSDGSPVVRSYLRFDVQGLSGSVTKATLSLLPASSLAAVLTAHSVADNGWSESTLTDRTAPPIGVALGSVQSVVSGTALSFDVTPAVPGNGAASFALTNASSAAMSLWSREAGGTRAPQLTVVTTTAPPPPPPTDGQPSFPVRGAFFYPWFPEAWNQSGMNPFTHYHPSAGFYDSGSTAVIQKQVQAMQYGKINLGIASWWGQRTTTDSRIGTLLSTTDGMNSPFRWALYYEPEGYSDPTAGQITNDLAYIRDHYGGDPAYYRVNGRFVVFVYADGADACGMADRWALGNTLINAYVVLKVFPGYRNCVSQPARWHQYGPAVAEDSQTGNSFTISPGFWKPNEATPRLARAAARWSTNIRDMVASNAPLQLVTTFNEWGEGTSVESADEWASPSGYGAYLDALHNNG